MQNCLAIVVPLARLQDPSDRNAKDREQRMHRLSRSVPQSDPNPEVPSAVHRLELTLDILWPDAFTRRKAVARYQLPIRQRLSLDQNDASLAALTNCFDSFNIHEARCPVGDCQSAREKMTAAR
jgi:hypothetical protein